MPGFQAVMPLTLRSAFRHPEPGSSPGRWVFLALGAAVLGIALVFGALLWELRVDARKAAEVSGVNLATALAQDLSRNLDILDLSIEAARDSWADPKVRALDSEMKGRLIFDHSATARYIDSILVIDRDGAVVADSRSAVPRTQNYRDAGFFKAQVEQDVGLFIGPPIMVSAVTPGTGGWRLFR